MSNADDLWEWIRTPLEDLKQSFTAEPGEPWETRREEFLQRLGIREPDEHPVTEQIFAQLDDLTDDERKNQVTSGQFESAAFACVQQHAASQEAGHGEEAGHGQVAGAATEGPGYDEHAWQDFLQANATQWDGSQESWTQFTQWFLYYADQAGLAAPATALINYLHPLSPDQRITELSRYGVTITPAQQPPAEQGQQPPAEHAEADPADETHQQIAAIMDDVLGDNAELNEIPEERRMEILNEVLAELRTTVLWQRKE